MRTYKCYCIVTTLVVASIECTQEVPEKAIWDLGPGLSPSYVRVLLCGYILIEAKVHHALLLLLCFLMLPYFTIFCVF